jgi:hypothetical protein
VQSSKINHFRRKTGDKESGRLLGDGLPAVLTSDSFMARVVDRDEEQSNGALLKEARKKTLSEQKEALPKWINKDQIRLKQNKADTRHYGLELKERRAERDLAKRESRKPRWNKPPKKPNSRPKVPRPVGREVGFELLESGSSGMSTMEDNGD